MADFERTFEDAADVYERNRPAYPRALYDDLFRYRPLGAWDSTLEIGAGTGKATGPILDAGCRIVGIEPGERLAALARARFRNRDRFSLDNRTFEAFDAEPDSFDLVYAATAFHWIPEEYGYRRVFAMLKSGGAFARFAYHAWPDRGRLALTEEIQRAYRRFMPATPEPKEFGETDARRLAGVAARYGFADAEYRLYGQTKDFTADQYVELLKTYPNHMALDEPDRRGLFEEIHAAIERHGGTMTVYYAVDMELARKL